MSNYSELLKDPRWQKKSLEILSADRWCCRNCESKTRTLHVHHLYYEKGCDPWDYPDGALITLCNECHEEAHKINWQKAFLDLNLTPQRLLSLALTYKFLIDKHQRLTADVLNKYQMRVMPELCILPEVDRSESMEEVHEIMDYQKSQSEQYHG